MSMRPLSIFRDPSVFDVEYVPPESMIVHRDRELDDILYSVQGLLMGMPPMHVYLQGVPATGKTMVAKAVLRAAGNLERAGNVASPVVAYVDAKSNKTGVEMMRAIAQDIGIAPGGDDKWISTLTDRIFRNLSRRAKGKQQPFILVIDEIHFPPRREVQEILYKLLRPGNRSPNFSCIKTLVIAISSGEPSFMDEGLRSLLSPHVIVFDDYTTEQKFDILKQRCLQGFGRGVIDDELIYTVAARSSDLRHALKVLYQAGNIANLKSDTQITEEYIEQALATVPPDSKRFISNLSKLEKFLLKEVIKKGEKGITTAELHRRCTMRMKEYTLRYIEIIMAELERKGLVRSKKQPYRDKRGQAKWWYPCVNLKFSEDGAMAAPSAAL